MLNVLCNVNTISINDNYWTVRIVLNKKQLPTHKANSLAEYL